MFHSEPYYAYPNTGLLKKVGKYIKKIRLELNMTQGSLAEKTGLDRSSISGFENGKGTSLLTLIQVLRVLGKLDIFAPFFDDNMPVSPILMVKLQGKQRKHASTKRQINPPKNDPEW